METSTKLKETVAGTAAGIVGKLAEHPLDLVKTRIQARAAHSAPAAAFSVRQVVARIAQREGVLGFYRGVGAPLVGAALENMLAFTVYSSTVSALSALAEPKSSVLRGGDVNSSNNNTSGPSDAPLLHVAIGGAVAGVSNAVILSPVELIKCRMAVSGKYSSTFDCVQRTLRTEGARALTRGWSATLAREVPGTTCYFVAYETALRKLSALLGGSKRNDAPWWAVPLAGATAGCCYTLVPYPVDAIGTVVRTDKKFASMPLHRVAAAMYARGGLRAFFAGAGVGVFRALPRDAAIFAMYEFVMRSFGTSA